MEKHIIVNSNYSVYESRPDLIWSASQGIADVARIAGYIPITYSPNLENSLIISQIEAASFNPYRGQIDLDVYRDNLLDAIPGIDATDSVNYVLTDLDVYGGELNFAFGATFSEVQFSIQSLARFIRIPSLGSRSQNIVARHIARHETGHLAGLIPPYPDQRADDIFINHCGYDYCTMHQMLDESEAIEAAHNIEYSGDSSTAGFCVNCLDQLLAMR